MHRIISNFLLCLLMCFISSVSANKILFLGDSLTAGYGIAVEKSFVSLIEKALKKDTATTGQPLEIIGAGISGSTSASALSRLRWHLRAKLDVLVLALGANDGLRGFEPQVTYDNLAKTIELALNNNVKVLLTGMKALPNYGKEYTTKYEAVFENLVKKYDIIYMPFLLVDVAGNPKFNQRDGIHPNESGHQIIANNLLPYVLESLE